MIGLTLRQAFFIPSGSKFSPLFKHKEVILYDFACRRR